MSSGLIPHGFPGITSTMKLPTSGWKPGWSRVPSSFLECVSFEFNLSRTSFACRSGSTCRRLSSKMTRNPSVCLKNQQWLCQTIAFFYTERSLPRRPTEKRHHLDPCTSATMQSVAVQSLVTMCFNLGKLQAYSSYLHSALSNQICCGLRARPVQSISSIPMDARIIW